MTPCEVLQAAGDMPQALQGGCITRRGKSNEGKRLYGWKMEMKFDSELVSVPYNVRWMEWEKDINSDSHLQRHQLQCTVIDINASSHVMHL